MALSLLLGPDGDFDSLASAREQARSALGYERWDCELTSGAGLPPDAVHLARLACMSGHELYALALPPTCPPRPAPIEFVSPSNERLALLFLRTRLGDLGAHEAATRDLDERLAAFVDGSPSPETAPSAVEATPPPKPSFLGPLARELGLNHATRVVSVGGDRGLVAARALQLGEVVVSVPLAAVVCAHTCCVAEPWLSAALDAIDEGEWTANLRLMVILVRERRRASKSRWSSWLDRTDVCQPNCTRLPFALYWVRHALVAEIDEFLERLLPELCVAFPDLFPAGPPSSSEWRWVRAVVATRAIVFNVKSTELPLTDGKSEPALVPLLDMLQHSPRSPLEHSIVGSALELRALTPLSAGASLTLDYGSRMGASELLLQHGVGPGKCVCVLCVCVCVCVFWLIWTMHWLTERDPLPSPLLLAARLLVLDETEVKTVDRAFQGEPVGPENERRALLLLQEVISALLEPADPYADVEEQVPAAEAAAAVTQTAIIDYCEAHERICRTSLELIEARLLGLPPSTGEPGNSTM
ncbi:hypothetical protein T492DRAFT_947892 [Pavlovales sp. CCMP2436]|nr:hypothetical protein T492DRAFT_947892 [Pavlovales sp. CCMP2436]